MPDLKKAELIERVVYVPSPVRADHHAAPHADATGWLTRYRARTSGVTVLVEASIRLDLDNLPQPDAAMLLDPHRGGRARIGEDGYVEGAPELILEVAASSASYDLHDKLHAYRRNGVREYLVWRVLDRTLDWFVLRGGHYELLPPGDDGIHRSGAFPGLWLDALALLRGDLLRVDEVLAGGLASPEHAAFADGPTGISGK